MSSGAVADPICLAWGKLEEGTDEFIWSYVVLNEAQCACGLPIELWKQRDRHVISYGVLAELGTEGQTHYRVDIVSGSLAR